MLLIDFDFFERKINFIIIINLGKCLGLNKEMFCLGNKMVVDKFVCKEFERIEFYKF